MRVGGTPGEGKAPVTHFVTRFDPTAMAMPAEAKDHGEGYVRVATLGFHTGALHTGHAICELAPGGIIEPHLHPDEQSFYPESCANTSAQERNASAT